MNHYWYRFLMTTAGVIAIIVLSVTGVQAVDLTVVITLAALVWVMAAVACLAQARADRYEMMTRQAYQMLRDTRDLMNAAASNDPRES